jgi:hypothetical protein
MYAEEDNYSKIKYFDDAATTNLASGSVMRII